LYVTLCTIVTNKHVKLQKYVNAIQTGQTHTKNNNLSIKYIFHEKQQTIRQTKVLYHKTVNAEVGLYVQYK